MHFLDRFRKSENGSVALMATVAAVCLVGIVGLVVDYSRTTRRQANLQSIADMASIAAAQLPGATKPAREAAAQAVVNANMQFDDGLSSFKATVDDLGTGVRVTLSGTVPTTFSRVLGFNGVPVTVVAETGMGNASDVEIALVLDTTGSMINDMPAMKAAAKQFTQTVFQASKGNLKMAVVPYVASVNVGTKNLSASMQDTAASSTWHGSSLRLGWANYMNGCNPCPTCTGGGGGGGGPPDPGPGSPSGKDKTTLKLNGNGLAWIADELLGIRAAHAADVTPNTIPPLSGTWYTPGAPYVTDGSKAFLPTGFSTVANCWLLNPPKVSNFDLLKRIPGANWKGCLEARPEPFDVTDDAPTAGKPETLFVPYFWPSEPNVSWSGNPYNNSYLDDDMLGLPAGWGDTGDWARHLNLFKYRNKAPLAKFKETGPITSGPNASCPDEMQPLTSIQGNVVSRIETLNYYNGGGTISSEGIMWGWRALSPNKPFAMGAAYGSKTKKIIVLMSDGLNSLVANNAVAGFPLMSDYTAYGYLTSGRFPQQTFASAESYLNTRMRAACTNAKAKGITIFTVLFRETNAATKALMKECATAENNFVWAGSSSELANAFNGIAMEIANLRLTK